MRHRPRLPHAWFAAVLLAAGAIAAGRASATPEVSSRPRAVIELFASQGCSASRPAISLLAELAREPTLVVLTLPVDYWDYLGWKDTQAQPAFSARQRAYSAKRGDRQIFTPQIVVNGVAAGVGAPRQEVDQAIERAVVDRSPLRVDVRLREEGGAIRIEVGEAKGTGDVWLLPVRRRHEVAVQRGENQGRQVGYINVVREVRHIGAWSGSPVTYSVPVAGGFPGDADAYVVLLQETSFGKPGAILGAAKGPGL